MSKKAALIKKIEGFEAKYFNDDQKVIAIKILQDAPEQEVQAYADFIFMKRRTGFGFDYSPEIAKGKLITLKEDQTKRINVNDEVQDDENKLIIGDNYNALKSLLVTHKNRIDIIYIDPPYNTEAAKNDGNHSSKEDQSAKFVYKDKFGRGGWLNMMKTRLILAKDLLSEQGAIFVSIDDNEYGYLRVLMDEIFGEEHFICSFIWEKRCSPQNINKFVSTNHDYILCYRKTNNLNKFERFSRTEKNNQYYKYDDHDGRGLYRIGDLTVKNGHQYKIKINNKIYEPGRYRGWLRSETKMQKLISENRIHIPTNNSDRLGIKCYLSEANEIVSETILNYQLVGHTAHNQKKLNQILNTQSLNYPKKGIKLIKYLLELIPNQQNAIILDFFAGSGTTGHAVMELNQADNGNRKFILCTNNHNNIAEKVTYERLHRIINGRSFSKKDDFVWIKKHKPYKNEKLRVIIIDDSVMIALDQNIENQIYQDAVAGLKLLDGKYNKKDLNLYYDLAALNPLKNKVDVF